MEVIRQPSFDFIDAEPKEMWVYASPKKGDHIRVDRGPYQHHGIYVSNKEVIHFTGHDGDNVLDWSNAEVLLTDLEYFLKGDQLEVKDYTDEEMDDLYPVESIVLYARASLGEKGYNLIFNNCEHFANACTLGRHHSGQVERFFRDVVDLYLIKNGGYGQMKLVDGFKNFISGIFGKKSSNRSMTNTTYEPDKVKIAEIERDVKLKLADKELERIELMKNARIEMLESEAFFRAAIEEARVKGFHCIVQTIKVLQEQMNEIMEKRIRIIESGTLQVVQDVDAFYSEIGERINNEKQEYMEEKLPRLLEIMSQFEEGSDMREIYKKQVDEDASLQRKYFETQMKCISERQDFILNGLSSTQDRIVDQMAGVTEKLIDQVAVQYGDVAIAEPNVHQVQIEGETVQKKLRSGLADQ